MFSVAPRTFRLAGQPARCGVSGSSDAGQVLKALGINDLRCAGRNMV